MTPASPPDAAAGAPTPDVLPSPPVPPNLTLPAPGSVSSSTIPTGETVTLAEAVRLAQQNHANVVVAEESVVTARERVTEARAGTRPNVQGEIGYTVQNVQTRGNGIFGRSNFITDRGLQPVISMSYTPFDNGLTRAAVRQAQASVAGNVANLQATQNDLAFNVASNYLAQLRAERLLSLRQTQEQLANYQLQSVQARAEEGAAAEVETALPLSEYRNRQVDRIQAENDVRTAANVLRNSMGLPVGPALRLVEPADTTAALPALAEMRDLAMRTRPEVVQTEADVRAQQEAVSIAKIERNPRLTTQVNVNVTPTAANERSRWTAGAAITMPIFDAGVTRARQREAESGLRAAQARLEQIRKDVTAEVEDAYLNLASARERSSASQLAVDAARANLEAATSRYQLGVRGISVVDLVNAQVQYNTASTDAIQALYDVYLAQSQLERAIGRMPAGTGS